MRERAGQEHYGTVLIYSMASDLSSSGEALINPSMLSTSLQVNLVLAPVRVIETLE
jgi:hypothetical protein